MSCIVTLKINDYYPKIDSIPYENLICLFTYGDFFVKIPLIQKSNNICKHEIDTISTDIKYNIHVLECNESSLIGISELVIPFIKIKKINAPGTMIQEQKIKLIIDLNTKRKLFGKLINAGDIYLVLSAEVFIPDKKNIIINNEINNININDNMKKKNNNKQIQVRTSNNKNKNMDGTPRTLKKKKMIFEIKSNREIIKKDLLNKNVNNNYNKNNIINYDFSNSEKNLGKFKNKNKLDNNIKIIDFKNKNDSLAKDMKKKLSKKRSPKKKVTILELLEQKIQPLLSNNNIIINNRSNTNSSIGNNNNNLMDISDNKKYNNNTQKILNIKNNNNGIVNNINNILKGTNKKEDIIKSNKYINSLINSQDRIIISPAQNISSPNSYNTHKIKINNSKSKRINTQKKYSNGVNIYNYNIFNDPEMNNNNKLLIRNKRNSSLEAKYIDKYKANQYKDKNQNIKDSFILGHYKLPKIDLSMEMFNRKSYNNKKVVKDIIKKNNSSYSNINNNDITSNNGLLSTDERTEQGLSEIDKIILEKGAELRDQFHNQLKYYNSNNIELNNSTKRNNLNINQLYYHMGDNQIIGAGNYRIKTPKTSQDIDIINNVYDNRSSFSSSQSLKNYFNQEDLKNNYIKLIDLYHLLNTKLSNIIFENNDLYKKLKIYKEKYNNEIKKDDIRNNKINKYDFHFFINSNLKQSFNINVAEKLAYIKNVEGKLYQDIFGYIYNDYEIIRIKEIERVNKLNEDRKLNVLLKTIKSIIIDCGNVSQIFHDDKIKEKLLKDVLIKNNIIEKKEGEENYINLQNFNFNNNNINITNNNSNNNFNYNNKNNNFRKYKNILDEDDMFENKVIREVDEDKEDESNTTSNNKKSKKSTSNNLNEIDDSQNIESICQSHSKNEETSIKNNNNESYNEESEIKNNIPKTPKNEEKIENESITNDKQSELEEENQKINIMKDILINNFKEKYGKKSLFYHLNKNEFLFDDKYNIIVELNNNNEIIIEIEKNKYNLDEFISKFYKSGNEIENKDNNIIGKKNFIYIKKTRKSQNKINIEKNKIEKEENDIKQHQKKRSLKRITDEQSEEEEKQNIKNEEINKEISSDEKQSTNTNNIEN